MGLAANNRNEAIRTATTNAELQVAIQLKRTWNQIKLASMALQPPRTLPDNPSDEDFQRMAIELIDQRQFTINGQTVSLADMDASPELAEMRQGLPRNTFQQLVPTRRQISLIANEVGNGVYENTGNIGFLRGATIGSALSGLFSWIFSGFRGGFQGLMDSIAGNTAGNMQRSVTNNLSRLRHRLQGTEDDLTTFLTDRTITDIGTSLHGTVLHRANSNLPAPAAETLAGVTTGDLGDSMRSRVRDQMRTTIRNGIITGLSGSDAFSDVLAPSGTETATGIWGGAWRSIQNAAASRLTSSVLGLSPAERLAAANAIADGVSDRLSSIIADPNYRYQGNAPHLLALRNIPLSAMSEEDKAKVLAEEAKLVVEGLANTAQASGNVRLAALYTKVAEEMPAQVEASIRAQSASIPWFIAGQQTPGALTQSTQAARGLLGTLTPLSPADRSARLTAILEIGLSPASEAGRRLRTMVGGDVGQAHFNVITSNASAAIDEINTRTQSGQIPASGEGRYIAISQLLRERFQDPAFITQINNANPAQPLNVTPEMMAILADQMTGQLLGEAPNTPEYATYNASVMRNRGAVAATMIGPEIVTGLQANATQLQEAANGTPLTDENYNAIAAATQPILAEYAANPAALAALGPDAYRVISDRIRTALIAQRDTINGAGPNGVVLSEATLASMADDLTVRGIEGIVSANTGSTPPLTLPAIPTGPGSFSAQRTERREAAVASIVARKLEDNPGMMQQLAQSENPLQPAAYQAIGAAAAPVLVRYMADPAKAALRESGPAAYQQVAAELETALANGDINVGGANFNESTRRLLAQQMAVQVVEGLYPPGEAPQRPEAFRTSMTTGATPLVNAQLTTRLQSNEIRDVLATIGTLPANTTTVAATDPALATIATSASPVIAAMVTNPPRLPDGSYDPAIYANLARDIRASLPATGITNATGLSLSPAALDALSDTMAQEAVRNALGNNAPRVPDDFAQRIAANRTAIIQGRIVTELGSPASLRALRQLSGLPTMGADHPAITAIARSAAPVFEQHLGSDTAKTALRARGPAAYQEIADQLFNNALTPANIGGNFNENARRLLAQQMAVQIVEGAYGPDQPIPARPAAFQNALQTNALPVITAEVLTELKKPAMRTTLGEAAGITNLPENHAGLPVLAGIVAPGLAPLATNARNWRVGNTVPPTYRDAIYQDTATAILAELNRPANIEALNTAGIRLTPEVRAAMANEMAVQVVQQQLGDRAPAIPAAFTTQRNTATRTATQSVIQARVLTGLNALPPNGMAALTMQNDYNNINTTQIATLSSAVLINYRFQSNVAGNAGYNVPRTMPTTTAGQQQLENEIQVLLRTSYVNAGYTPAAASRMARSVAQNFVDTMPVDQTPGVTTQPRPARPQVTATTVNTQITSEVRTQVAAGIAGIRTTVSTSISGTITGAIPGPLGRALGPTLGATLTNDAMSRFSEPLFQQQVAVGVNTALADPRWGAMNPTQRRDLMRSSITSALDAPYPGRPGETYFSYIFPSGVNLPTVTIPDPNPLNARVVMAPNPISRHLPNVPVPIPGTIDIGGGRIDLTPPARIRTELLNLLSDQILDRITTGNQTLSAAPQLNRDGVELAMGDLGNLRLQNNLPNLPAGIALDAPGGVRQA
jgi:hypothetical protein